VVARLTPARCTAGNPTRIYFTGRITVTANGSAAVRYRWFRSDGATGPILSAMPSRISPTNVTDEWDRWDRNPSGWEAVEIVSLNGRPTNIQSNHATFACSAGAPAASPQPPAARTALPGVTTLTGVIQNLRVGWLQLAVAGRAAIWVRDFGARILQNGRPIGANFLRVGERVQVQGRMVGAQLYATEISVVASESAPQQTPLKLGTVKQKPVTLASEGAPVRTPPATGAISRAANAHVQPPASTPKFAFRASPSPSNAKAVPAANSSVSALGAPKVVGNQLSWAGKTLPLAPAGPGFSRMRQQVLKKATSYQAAHKPLLQLSLRNRVSFGKKQAVHMRFLRFRPKETPLRVNGAALGKRPVFNNQSAGIQTSGVNIVGNRTAELGGERAALGGKGVGIRVPKAAGTFALMSLANNEDRSAFVQQILNTEAPTTPWNTAPAPLPPQQLNPNNFLVDPSSVVAFSSEFMSSTPCQPAANQGPPPLFFTCAVLPLNVTSPTITLTVPTHLVVVSGSATGNPQYSANAMPVQIELQELKTDSNGNATEDLNDPDGEDFTDIPGQPVVSAPAGSEPFNGSTPAWFWDIDADNAARRLGPLYTSPDQTTQAPCPVQQGVDCNVLLLAYPNPGAASASSSDLATFTLSLTSLVTLIRFKFTFGYATLASVPLAIVLQPTGAVQLNVLPTAIVYNPPGDQSTTSYNSSQQSGVSQTAEYSTSASQTQSQTNGGSFKVAATLGASYMGFSASVTASYGTNWDNTTSSGSTQNGSTSSEISHTTLVSDMPAIKPSPTGPPAQIWKPNTQYNAYSDLVQPNPPDGNAYLCVQSGTSGSQPPQFSTNGITQETGSSPVQWEYAGSAAVYEEPFWNDMFLLAVHPQYALFNFAGTSTSDDIQTMPLGAESNGWQISVFDLHLCAKGLNSQVATDPAATPPITLTSYECAGLLNMDPFYLNGQHTDPSQSGLGQPDSNGSSKDIDSGESDTISSASTSTTENGQSTGSSFTDTASATQGQTESLGVQAGGYGSSVSATATQSSSQTSGSGMTTTYDNTTKENSGQTQAIQAILQADKNNGEAYPITTKVYVDTRFGTLMFPAVTTTISSVSPSTGSCGTTVLIQGMGLSGATSVAFNGVQAAFTTNTDDQITAIAPSLPGTGPGATATITVSGEGIPATNASEQFTYTQTNCN
jgi:hypothetical protein